MRAHGWVGARATILFLSAPPPSEKSAGGFQQAGPEGKCFALPTGQAKRIFVYPVANRRFYYGARLLSAPKARLGWERLRSLALSREAPKQNKFATGQEESKTEKFSFP
ncbi:MAG: hypothetical protein DDT19_01675 [Syntrophomonadaceae bacterium]|nr:hypothetical protein [Bacillota bacterium]